VPLQFELLTEVNKPVSAEPSRAGSLPVLSSATTPLAALVALVKAVATLVPGVVVARAVSPRFVLAVLTLLRLAKLSVFVNAPANVEAALDALVAASVALEAALVAEVAAADAELAALVADVLAADAELDALVA
jgi:hypothetical protein